MMGGPTVSREAGPVPRNLPRFRRVRVGDEVKRIPIAYFWKPAISCGWFTHPVTGQREFVDRGRIDQWVENFRAMRADGLEVPTPVDHSDRAEDNRGFVVAMRRTGDTLQVLHQAIGKDAIKLAMRNRCSVLINPHFTDAYDRKWGEVIEHSAYTPKPVIHGHGEFQAFAASRAGTGRRVPVFYNKRSVMTLAQKKALRKLLKIKKGRPVPTEQKLLPELIKLIQRQNKRLDALQDAEQDDAPPKKRKPAARDEDDEDQEERTDADEDFDEDEDVDEEDDSDEDAEDEAEEEEQPKARKPKKLAASRTLPSGSAVDSATAVLLSRAIQTEREAAVGNGGITPETADALDELFMDGDGRPTKLALSRTSESGDPLYFEVLKVLQNNKRVPLRGEQSGSQSRTALSRETPTSQTGDTGKQRKLAKETELDVEEDRQWASRQKGVNGNGGGRMFNGNGTATEER